jgi:hypothetical protein
MKFSKEQLAAMQADLGLPGSALDDKYNPEGDAEHPAVTRQMWREAVAQHETISGYWDWAAHRIALAFAPQIQAYLDWATHHVAVALSPQH